MNKLIILIVVFIILVLSFGIYPLLFEPTCDERATDTSYPLRWGTFIRTTTTTGLVQSPIRIITEDTIAPGVCGVVRSNDTRVIAGVSHNFVKFTNTLRTPRGWVPQTSFVVIGAATPFEFMLFVLFPILATIFGVLGVILIIVVLVYQLKGEIFYKKNVKDNLEANRIKAIKEQKAKIKALFEDIYTNKLTSPHKSEWLNSILQADAILYTSLKLVYPKYQELGYVELLKKLIVQSKKDKEFKKLLTDAQYAHYLRNRVAHAEGDEVVSKQKIEQALKKIEKLLEHLEFFD